MTGSRGCSFGAEKWRDGEGLPHVIKSRGAHALSGYETGLSQHFLTGSPAPCILSLFSCHLSIHCMRFLLGGREGLSVDLNIFTQIGQSNKDGRVGMDIQVSGALG